MATSLSTARYDNYRMYEMQPSSDTQLEILKDIESNSDSFIFILEPRSVNNSVVVIVAPHKFAEFDSILSEKKIRHQITAYNVQSLIDDEQDQLTRTSESFGWKKYYPLESIYTFMDSMLEQYPDVTSSIYIGKTYEKRDIKGVKISYKDGNPGIFVEGGIHAREWIGPAVVTFLLNVLLSSQNESIRNMAENYDWYIVPSVNPDGYVYTHTTNRLWRKTRKPYYLVCYGADPNRNWDIQFGKIGASPNPCSDTYPGPQAFSEVEMKSYSEYLKSLKDKIHTFIAFHAYSQLLLFPYGHTPKKVKNYDDLLDIGRKTIEALAKRYNTKYKVGNIYTTIYPVSGSSMDWTYDKLSVPISYTYELRPNSSHPGFELPASEIIPTALETVDSIVALTDRAKELGYYKWKKTDSN